MKQVLALDIGGTNSRIALIEVTNKPVIKQKKAFLTKDVKNISSIINKFNKNIDTGCIGFAGPITGNKAKLTNANLTIDINKIKKQTKLKNITLINDFQANGYGVQYLKSKDLFVLNKGNKSKNKVIMATGPGTGLGKSIVINNKVYPCEPGWTTFGIEDIEDYALLDYLHGKYPRTVYCEDVLSGRGIINIYNHLAIKSNLEMNMKIRKLVNKENNPEIITKYSSKNDLCDMTLKEFTKFYSRYIRDSCLHLLTNEVYLVGSISNSIKPYLQKYFKKEFLKHAVYKDVLKSVKVNLVLTKDLGLIGTGAVAAKLT